jgi:hypothetical protein
VSKYGKSAKKRARFIAFDNSRCFFAETAVMRLGTIFPLSDIKRCNNLTSL